MKNSILFLFACILLLGSCQDELIIHPEDEILARKGQSTSSHLFPCTIFQAEVPLQDITWEQHDQLQENLLIDGGTFSLVSYNDCSVLKTFTLQYSDFHIIPKDNLSDGLTLELPPVLIHQILTSNDPLVSYFGEELQIIRTDNIQECNLASGVFDNLPSQIETFTLDFGDLSSTACQTYSGCNPDPSGQGG